MALAAAFASCATAGAVRLAILFVATLDWEGPQAPRGGRGGTRGRYALAHPLLSLQFS